MNPQITNLVIMLAMMQISRRLDMESPTTVLYIRIAYVVSVIITWSIYQLARNKIIAKKDKTTLKYAVPGNQLTGEPERLEVTTVFDYDLKEVDSAIKSIYSSVAMMGFMHLYMKYTNPLFMQLISPIKGALESNEVKIHLFNKPAVGDLKRPFKAASMFGSFGQSGNPGADASKSDKKSVEQLEVAGTGGIKSD
ncbi:hypothetical protein TBLA_0H01600 [Henningerozyma blattae CBS 6284]|uniref:Uncharacterized protein n=1 Tax=Henningerozyma blattae (strain ATCC 34711 / CBS 6284 / DSM 70876 / NBRC 10599 / NRRL Y-10934 / UCD 77-7) TaxID=1071380 RepID=I2H7U5_HENB6|nr:hypothetical protein TBLA_0H01600 [Tetrapisispora blattae CBS 6284]CCH62447.1 hypothetical protein TBLA_0H01600 [Tetrapisispora blattae CBS 6284]